MMLIAHIEHTTKHHEHVTWWKPDSLGYTFCIDKAGVYDEAEAASICQRGSCIAIPKSFVEVLAHGTPYYRKRDATLAKMYDGDQHRVIPNSITSWKLLMDARLNPRFLRPSKPTPISIRASRAIYIDGVS